MNLQSALNSVPVKPKSSLPNRGKRGFFFFFTSESGVLYSRNRTYFNQKSILHYALENVLQAKKYLYCTNTRKRTSSKKVPTLLYTRKRTSSKKVYFTIILYTRKYKNSLMDLILFRMEIANN
uniref:Uncharacterized protein n=1 Tax=Cacopsylla melanoneura TaxID=428564 RepID=A0A8D8WR28_9HEMI